ncbi:Serine/threonine-protein kinase tel1, partial [Ascosphaera acerosa]
SKELQELQESRAVGVLDALIGAATAEQAVLHRAGSSGTRSNAILRLEAALSTFRLAVEVFGRRLRTKAVGQVIDRVVNFLEQANQEVWHHASSACFKSLRLLFEYAPHVEHLSRARWTDICHFCLRTLTELQSDSDQLNGSSRESSLNGSMAVSITSTSTGVSTRQRQHPLKEGYGVRVELEMSIQLLCCSPTAPLTDEGPRVLEYLLEYLSCIRSPSSGAHCILRAFNTVLTAIMTSNMNLCQSALLNALSFLRELFVPKSATLQEEMLVTLHLASLLLPHASDIEIKQALQKATPNLLDHLQTEYLSMSRRDKLQLDDLTMWSMDTTPPMGLQGLGPRLGSVRAEGNWTLLKTIAAFSVVQNESASAPPSPIASNPPSEERCNKRVRLSSSLRDHIHDAHASVGDQQMLALQLLPFYLSSCSLSANDLQDLIERLIAKNMVDRDEVQSWTMIAFAHLVHSEHAFSTSIRPLCREIWSLAMRSLSSAHTSRAACYAAAVILTQRLLDESVVVAAADTVLSSLEMTGPAGLSDASLLLWQCLVSYIGNLQPLKAQRATAQVCAWLRSAWAVDALTDKATAAQLSAYAHPAAIVNLLLTCTGRPELPSEKRTRGPATQLLRAWLVTEEDAALRDYLVLTPTKDYSTTKSMPCSGSVSSATDSAVLELLQTKLKQAQRMWDAFAVDNVHLLTSEAVCMAVSLCVTASFFLHIPDISSATCQNLAIESAEALWSDITKLLEERDPSYFVRTLETLGPLLIAIKPFSATDSTATAAMHKTLKHLGNKISDLTRHMIGNAEDKTPSASQASATKFDAEDDPNHQNIALTLTDSDLEQLRGDISAPVYPNLKTFARAVALQWLVVLTLPEPLASEAPSALVSLLCSLSGHDLLVWRPIFLGLAQAPSSMSRPDACRLLEHFGDSCLMAWDVQKSEAAHALCIHAVSFMLPMLALDDSDDLEAAANDLLTWFTNSLVENAQGTPRAMARVATLYHDILTKPTIEASPENAGPFKQNLYTMLRGCDLRVKYHICQFIPDLFARSNAQSHDRFFDDIFESFPNYFDWLEGTAVRLSLLGQLGSHCSSILRRSMYRIFETAGQIPLSAPYAQRCVHLIAKSLRIERPQDLLHLYAGQLLYTWLQPQDGSDRQMLTSIPFTIFAYPSLKDLLIDIQDEVVGQALLRGSDEEMRELSAVIGVPFAELLSTSFARAEAYIIAQSISVPPSQLSQHTSGERMIKALIGKQPFHDLLTTNFPNIVSILIQRVDEPDLGCVRRFTESSAADIWESIGTRSYSHLTGPVTQQPCFRAKYLHDELSYVCKRANIDLNDMWTSSMFSFVARGLMDMVQPALGSFQALSVLRKLRLLVCIAGKIVLNGYGAPMMLHFLRPFLGDAICAAEAMAMFWYIYENRTQESYSNTSFEIGLAIDTILSLRRSATFYKSAPVAAPQHAVCKARPTNFTDWLVCHLNTAPLSFCKASGDVEQWFKSLATLASESDGRGRSDARTSSGKLLRLLLEDQCKESPVIRSPAREELIRLLAIDFDRDVQQQWDILGDDASSLAFACSAWRLCPSGAPSNSYRLWAARALGRAHAASGDLGQLHPQEHHDINHECGADYGTDSSKCAIISVLCECLCSYDTRLVGLAETTIQGIVARLGASSASANCRRCIPNLILKSFDWTPFTCPSNNLARSNRHIYVRVKGCHPSMPVAVWAREMAISLCAVKSADIVLECLPQLLYEQPELAQRLLPYIVHDVLLSEFSSKQVSRLRLSEICNEAFQAVSVETEPQVRLLIRCILYLRYQRYPSETTADDRDLWLDIDYQRAASAALACGMSKTALLFIELHASHLATAPRRRSAQPSATAYKTILDHIFRSLDDPDVGRGIHTEVSVPMTLQEIASAGAVEQKLSIQSAIYDAKIRLGGHTADAAQLDLVRALNEAYHQGLASDLLTLNANATDAQTALGTALYLQQWDLPTPVPENAPIGSVVQAFKCLRRQADEISTSTVVDNSLLAVCHKLNNSRLTTEVRDCLQALASLNEIEEVSSTKPDELHEYWCRMTSRNDWMKYRSFSEIHQLLSCREALFAVLADGHAAALCPGAGKRITRELQFRTVQESLRISREHNDSQSAMNSAVLLTQLAPLGQECGLRLGNAALYDFAQVLWDQGDMLRCIDLLNSVDKDQFMTETAGPTPLRFASTKAHRIAEARLQSAREVRAAHLERIALKLADDETLRKTDRGEIFHSYAVFCDRQLSDRDTIASLDRIERLRNRKERELLSLESMLARSGDSSRRNLKSHRDKARAWFRLDDHEWQVQREAYDELKAAAVANYLRALADSDAYKDDVMRFTALWLRNAELDAVTEEVGMEIDSVPSRRFAPLVNQLFSRVSDEENDFQSYLQELLLRVCLDHPYHGMYQLFMSSKSTTASDAAGARRLRAANAMAEKLRADAAMGPTWVGVHNTNVVFVRFALEKPNNDKAKSGAKHSLLKSENGLRMVNEMPGRRLPPPTLKIQLRDDCDYSGVPVMTEYLHEYTIASGISAPKIVTVIASDGKRYKQLFKGGNDDLRQDLIMEQVFEQVSDLLGEQRETRQRQLGIRTYKVVPITANVGIIEFVQNTVPLNDYLLPAHAAHFPRDMSFKSARQAIFDAQLKSSADRVKAYQRVANNFHPVLRFFFMERFLTPDEWYSKRLAYTRSTAAISMLGYVLGLGDRHGHNILLDEQTGEVVHIDLGVAFEQGRILPIPEVVPFRLTRDLVDGMGITGTEGVFKKSCEATLEALRRDSYSIMTILDVLRYDPLYSWTLSPLKAKKMQDTQEAADDAATNGRQANEPSEADRALAVVEKKLSRSLSAYALVNRLIADATSEQNLAVLYCGWAAFA